LYIRKSLTNVLIAVSGVIALVTIALWQFYLFVAFRRANGAVELEGAGLHFWLAVGIALMASLAAFFVFLLFFRYNRHDRLPIISCDEFLVVVSKVGDLQ
jgi:hypothetical protein